jgi:L-ascorbate metabolism protein UlaG (beta-lactamase superfamily)
VTVLHRALLLLLLALPAAGCCTYSSPAYHGPPSDHFDGEQFFNAGVEQKGIADLLRWQRTRERGVWRDYADEPPGPPPPRRVGPGQLRVTFVNHATTLIQADGLNVLTDPIWSERPSPLSWIGPRRVRPPGIRFEDLPPIDAVLISHDHYDHLDVPTLQRLSRRFPRARFYAGLGNAAFLAGKHIRNVRELDWWQELRLGQVTLAAVPAQHFSNRGLCDRNCALFAGYVLKGPAGVIFFAGDTGFGPHFAEIRRRYGPARLALLPIGAYKPEWFMGPIHMSPLQAVQAHEALGARTSVAIHFGTFDLADDGQDEAPAELRRALAQDPAARFWVLGFGEGRDVPL